MIAEKSGKKRQRCLGHRPFLSLNTAMNSRNKAAMAGGLVAIKARSWPKNPEITRLSLTIFQVSVYSGHRRDERVCNRADRATKIPIKETA
jgi:hypothetical protein